MSRQIEVWLKSDKNIGHIRWISKNTYTMENTKFNVFLHFFGSAFKMCIDTDMWGPRIQREHCWYSVTTVFNSTIRRTHCCRKQCFNSYFVLLTVTFSVFLATVFIRTRHSVTLHVHCVSGLYKRSLFSFIC